MVHSRRYLGRGLYGTYLLQHVGFSTLTPSSSNCLRGQLCIRLPDESFTDVHIVELLGPYPPDFVKRCERRAEYFDDAGGYKVALLTRAVR